MEPENIIEAFNKRADSALKKKITENIIFVPIKIGGKRVQMRYAPVYGKDIFDMWKGKDFLLVGEIINALEVCIFKHLQNDFRKARFDKLLNRIDSKEAQTNGTNKIAVERKNRRIGAKPNCSHHGVKFSHNGDDERL